MESPPDVYFGDDSGLHNADCWITPASGGGGGGASAPRGRLGPLDPTTNFVSSITVNPSYGGTVFVGLNISLNGFTLNGGAISQFLGVGASDITTSSFNWSAGILNNAVVKAVLNIVSGSGSITGGDLTCGDDLNLNGFRLQLNNTGDLTFNNNAGISLSNDSYFDWTSTTNIVSTGSGIILNSDGTLWKATTIAEALVKCDLPYVNNGSRAGLMINRGTLAFTRAGPTNGVSVLQNDGAVILGIDGARGATLQVNQGFTMNGGRLDAASGFTSYITIGDVKVHGGLVRVGETGWGALTCAGDVTMDGGTYLPIVDFRANKASLWKAKSFGILFNAQLRVSSLNIPDPIPTVPFHILETTAVNKITGNFANANNLLIGTTGKKYTGGMNANNLDYDITTP